MSNIRQYFNTLEITKGFFIAFLASLFIYLNHWGFSHPIFITIFALASLFLLLQSHKTTWGWYGTFIGIFWFWWISLSLQHYGYPWGFPIGVLIISLLYGVIFYFIAWLSEQIEKRFTIQALFIKALSLFILSFMHPFGFDWLKPELMLVESYLGIEKWRFGLILLAISLSIWKKNLLFLLLVIFAYSPQNNQNNTHQTMNNIQIISTNTSVKEKWNKALHPKQFQEIFAHIDQAIINKKSLIILPESVFPIFLNRSQQLLDKLHKKSKKISIVTGGLYWDNGIPRNSTYIFTNNKLTIANKVLLVPFGESNPLPSFLSDWINEILYDGAVDYEASSNVTDYEINGTTFRNAICFEATSEKLYVKNGNGKHPKNMIVLSNNGWFTPSIEPTLQKLLLQYYSKKYGTTIYHAVNMSKSYIIRNGVILKMISNP
ncbi:MAG: apolipoprotein N-acyltransferase [Sulfurovum sp.]|nr:apolipoprotein N-acyltransferase [Sulfurovum sp.]